MGMTTLAPAAAERLNDSWTRLASVGWTAGQSAAAALASGIPPRAGTPNSPEKGCKQPPTAARTGAEREPHRPHRHPANLRRLA